MTAPKQNVIYKKNSHYLKSIHSWFHSEFKIENVKRHLQVIRAFQVNQNVQLILIFKNLKYIRFLDFFFLLEFKKKFSVKA